jgi:hypothetical protein
MTIEDISGQEGVAQSIVQQSIDRCKEYRYRCSNEMVALRVNEVVIEKLDGVGEVFDRGLTAKKFVPAGGGKFRNVPDIAMQLKTIETIKSLQEVAQPKAPLVQNNTQFNNNLNAPGYQPGMSFESRLRSIREKRGLKNEDEEVIVDAIDADTDQSVEDELADIGVDLEEGEEEGDD